MAITEYSSKAEYYHKYRWDYHRDAIKTIQDKGNVTSESIILDIGAGTGILTKHFSDIADVVYAVEPDSNMIAILKNHLDKVIPIQRYSDDIPEIPDNSIDLILAAHSLHWFDYHKTMIEFNRIAKQNCRIFSIENKMTSTGPFFEKTGDLYANYRDTSIQEKQNLTNIDEYFKDKAISEAHFDSESQLDFETYLGSIVSTSFMPSPGEDKYNKLQAEAEALFSKYAVEGSIGIQVRTTVRYGLLAEAG